MGWEAVADRGGTWDLMLDRRPWRLDLPDLDAVEEAVRATLGRRGPSSAVLQVVDRDGSRLTRQVTA